LGDRIWIEDTGIKVPGNKVVIGPRVGIDYAEEDALLPYRFSIEPIHLSSLVERT
jgi:DNA-3-methyladenine glycosylase